MDTFEPTPKKPIGRPRLGPNNTRKYEDKEIYNDYQNKYYHKHLRKNQVSLLFKDMFTSKTFKTPANRFVFKK